MSNHNRDPLESALNSDRGKAVEVGMLATGCAFIPAIAAGFIINPRGEIAQEEASLHNLEQQQGSLSESAEVLTERGLNDLSQQVSTQAETLNAEIATAKDSFPPHHAGDIATFSFFTAPFVVGALAGTIMYRKLKSHRN